MQKLNNWFSSGVRLAFNEAQFVSFIQFLKIDEGRINNLLKKKAAHIIDVHRPLSSNKKINLMPYITPLERGVFTSSDIDPMSTPASM